MKKYEFHTKRLITKKQEKVYRLCHQDFEGLTVEEAAKRLGISVIAVYKTLERLEKVAPQLFPILSKESIKIWGMWTIDGLHCWQIAEELGITESAVEQRLLRIKDKLGYTEIATAKPYRAISLDTMDMDTIIVKKF